MFKTELPLIILATLIVAAVVLLFVSVFIHLSQAKQCKNKDGVYIYRINKCVKKELFIPMENK